MVKNSGLGKGLSALIPQKSAGQSAANILQNNRLEKPNMIELEKIIPGRFQPRMHFSQEEMNELAESVKKNGVVQPIIVRVKPNTTDEYEIIAGERRWRASKIAGLVKVPVVIMEVDDRQAMEIALVENIQRQNLRILEEAEGYQRLINEFEYTQEQLAEVIGKSRSQIANTLRLLALPDEVKDFLNADKLTAGHARALLTAPNPSEAAVEVIKKDLSVRQTEKLVKKLGEPTKEKKKSQKDEAKAEEPAVALSEIDPSLFNSEDKDPEILRLEEELSGKIGMRVMISNQDEQGYVAIRYENLVDLDRLIRKLES